MTTITFDTLAYVKKLREAGIEEKQAEARLRRVATGQRKRTIPSVPSLTPALG